MLKYWLLFLIITSHFSCKTDIESTSVTGTVISIADGDTFTLLTDEKEKMKIRLHGIDCPERRQDFGAVAKQKLSELAFGKQVIVEKLDIDRYKRIIGLVYTPEGECVNEVSLSTGLAWHYTRYDNNDAWTQIEKVARAKKIGIWSRPDAVAPWEWRQNKNASSR